MNKTLSKIAFSHANLCYILATEHLWCLLKNTSLLEAHCQCMCQRFILPFHHTAPESTHSLLCLTNVLLKYRYVCFHCSILLYTFVVLQFECVWCLLSTMCTVKPCKLLVLLLSHCQWNHHDCMVSIPPHCLFKQTKFDIYYNQYLYQLTA